MRIAVIGTGQIGGTLGRKWRAAGHDVLYGSRKGDGEGPGGAPLMPIGDAIDGPAWWRSPFRAERSRRRSRHTVRC